MSQYATEFSIPLYHLLLYTTQSYLWALTKREAQKMTPFIETSFDKSYVAKEE